jgi:hypothetical protein
MTTVMFCVAVSPGLLSGNDEHTQTEHREMSHLMQLSGYLLGNRQRDLCHHSTGTRRSAFRFHAESWMIALSPYCSDPRLDT